MVPYIHLERNYFMVAVYGGGHFWCDFSHLVIQEVIPPDLTWLAHVQTDIQDADKRAPWLSLTKNYTGEYGYRG